MTIPDRPPVTAVYTLPVPIWVSCSALGLRYSSGIGGLRFDVVMPQDLEPVGGPPVSDGVSIPDSRDGELIEWTTQYAGWIPDDLQPATALRRVVITAVEAPAPEPPQLWRGPEYRLAEAIGSWFDRVRTWAEIYTGQDLDPAHRLYDSQAIGEGLAFIVPPRSGVLGVHITQSMISPVTAETWAWILMAVGRNIDPPTELVLHRDARAAHARGFYRRAAIDAAGSVEITLSRILNDLAPALESGQKKRLAGASLGRLISIARDSRVEFEVAYEDLENLVRVRNQAVHDALEPDPLETLRLLDTAERFLSAHRTG